MTMYTPNEEQTREELLRRAIQTSVPEVPAQFDQVEWKFVYMPTRHVRALDASTMLVKGIRGSGKSFWWFVLQEPSCQQLVFDGKLDVSVGYAQDEKGTWPERDELQQLLSLGIEPRLIWKTVVYHQTQPGAQPARSWPDEVQWLRENPSAAAQHFRELDRRLQEQGRTHMILFDGLDRTANTRADQERLLRGLLELVLEFRGYRALRAKVFARPDMLQSPGVRNFSDASKILASAASLEWRPVDLYGLLFKYLGNADDAAAAAEFRGLADPASTGSDLPPLPWNVPPQLREDEALQSGIFEKIAGPYMGTNRRRGRTYTWIPNHLSDALDNVSPRSFLAAIRRAADENQTSPHGYAIHWKGIQDGVRSASQIRVDEIQEDLPWAHTAMRILENLLVPCEQAKIIAAWKRGKLTERAEGGVPSNPETAMNELRGMGIFKVLPDGRVNIPDVYRVGFGLRRKGGFAPSRRLG